MTTFAVSRVRVALLLAIALNLGMIFLRVILYRPLLAMPGSLTFILEPVLLLILYGLAVLLMTSRPNATRESILQIGTPLGLTAGALQAVHILLENSINLGAVNGTVTLFSMRSMFCLWGVAGYLAGRKRTSLSPGALAGSWSAIVTMIVTVTFGLGLLFASIPRLDYVATWPEFQHSGWKDVYAFSIANTLDSAFSHLLIGPLIGAVIGGITGVIGRKQERRLPSAT